MLRAAQRLLLLGQGALELVPSEPLLNEPSRVLDYRKIRKRLHAHAIDTGLFLELLSFFTTQVDPAGVEVPTSRDADDQFVLVVLADQFPILTPAAFLERFLA